MTATRQLYLLVLIIGAVAHSRFRRTRPTASSNPCKQRSYIPDEFWANIGTDGRLESDHSMEDLVQFGQNRYVAFWMKNNGTCEEETYGEASFSDGIARVIADNKVDGGFKILAKSKLSGENEYEFIPVKDAIQRLPVIDKWQRFPAEINRLNYVDVLAGYGSPRVDEFTDYGWVNLGLREAHGKNARIRGNKEFASWLEEYSTHEICKFYDFEQNVAVLVTKRVSNNVQNQTILPPYTELGCGYSMSRRYTGEHAGLLSAHAEQMREWLMQDPSVKADGYQTECRRCSIHYCSKLPPSTRRRRQNCNYLSRCTEHKRETMGYTCTSSRCSCYPY